MPEPTPVAGLFETHLTVRDVGALGRLLPRRGGVCRWPSRSPERNVAFLWIGGPGHAMLGLWGLGSAPNAMALHTAFTVSLEDLLQARASGCARAA